MVAMWGFSVYSHEHPHEDIACKPSVTEPELDTFPCKRWLILNVFLLNLNMKGGRLRKKVPCSSDHMKIK